MPKAGKQLVLSRAIVPVLASPFLFGFVFGFPAGAGPGVRFARTYSAHGAVHFGITNKSGDITINSWNRREVAVRASSPAPVEIEERVSGDMITLSVVRPRRSHVDFEVSAPSDTSLTIRTTMGRIAVSGLDGHISIGNVNGDLHLRDIHSSCVEAKTLVGDIFFDGELTGDGPYILQSMTGDIDVILPESGSFDLFARSLSSNINLGGFLLNQREQRDQSISGRHDRGGPRLNLTTFEGRILLHKKK